MTPSDPVLAVDIETISTTDDPDFEDTSDWVHLAVGLGYRVKCGLYTPHTHNFNYLYFSR